MIPSGSGEMMSVPTNPIDGLNPMVPVSETPFDVLISMPQPI